MNPFKLCELRHMTSYWYVSLALQRHGDADYSDDYNDLSGKKEEENYTEFYQRITDKFLDGIDQNWRLYADVHRVEIDENLLELQVRVSFRDKDDVIYYNFKTGEYQCSWN